MMRGPRRRRWGWLVAIAYLFASMTPSLAAVVALDPIDLPMPHMHAGNDHAAGQQHSHADDGAAPHTHDEASLRDFDNDQDLPSDRHANCCGSILCFSAISPQAPSLVLFATLRSRCESEPDPIGDAGAFRRHYRPPIV